MRFALNCLSIFLGFTFNKAGALIHVSAYVHYINKNTPTMSELFSFYCISWWRWRWSIFRRQTSYFNIFSRFVYSLIYYHT